VSAEAMRSDQAATVARLCRGGARRAPDRLAIETESVGLTFAALDRRSESLAHYLKDAIAPGQRVGIYCSNRVEWVETYIAAHKAGISAVPINHRYRARELEHILGEADLGLVVHDDTVLADGDLQALMVGVPTLPVGAAYEAAASGSSEPVEPRDSDEDLIVYTSGTTALPKGVIYTRLTQLTSVAVPQLVVGYDPSDRFLLFTPLAHRAAQPLLLCALFMGATTYLLTEYSPESLIAAINDRGITALVGVPTALKDLLRLHEGNGVEPMSRVRHVFLSGEGVGSDLLRDIMPLFPNARFSSAYGSTEAGLVTFRDHEHTLTHHRSCGRALQGVDVRLVREDGSDAAGTESGEVIVRAGKPGTYTVAAGYLGATGVESFTDADGWFHTGDVATVDGDGFYAIVDRKKDMILSGGMNIASKEVEEIVASHEGVLEVAVTGEPDPRFGEHVVAWVVRRDGSNVTEADIVAHVASQAASYKKPSVVRFVESLPRSPTGKVQKRALRVDSDQVPTTPGEAA
jgi:long-chain acyl-CoA synthetase